MSSQDPFAAGATPNYDADGYERPAPSEPTSAAPAPTPTPTPEAPAPGFAPNAPGYASPAPHAPAPSGPTYPAPTYAAYPQQQPANTGTDGFAIAALVSGVLGTGIVALILGIVGLRRTSGGVRAGKGMSWAGIILGVVGILGWTAAIVGLVMFINDVDNGTFWGPGDSGSVIFDTEATYGDDPYLDSLWDQCAAGSDAACDVLYNESPFGSEYESFALSCGERGRPITQMWCETD